ncbi:unnamed protein product [Effrenium voratum]|uniref:Uncharacterized protein n=1 Tax=Effrenium voratum TaxID=2562239 RepID=A0AA36HRC0_9DINO|nr:unnamed protein product [Effrenium voratum]CAJ1461936.1 unnamed protein product [Effrenium voratum]
MALAANQQLAVLRERERQLVQEKEEILAKIADRDAEISWKKYAASQLERTLEALQAGSEENLPRSCAELRGASHTLAAQQSEETADSELMRRLAAALAELPKQSSVRFDEESFEKQFGQDADDARLSDFLSSLSAEQRLVWELQNPSDVSPKLDRRLLNDLMKAGKKPEVEVLRAAGSPSDVERQYRALLWLHHHADLNACHAEPGAGGQSLLTLACRHGQQQVAAALLERKADVHHTSSSQLSALSAACQRGSVDCARMLLQAAADPNEASKGCSVLAIAARCPVPEGLAVVKLLLEFRADANQVGFSGQTPFMAAAEAGNTLCKEALLEAGASTKA